MAHPSRPVFCCGVASGVPRWTSGEGHARAGVAAPRTPYGRQRRRCRPRRRRARLGEAGRRGGGARPGAHQGRTVRLAGGGPGGHPRRRGGGGGPPREETGNTAEVLESVKERAKQTRIIVEEREQASRDGIAEQRKNLAREALRANKAESSKSPKGRGSKVRASQVLKFSMDSGEAQGSDEEASDEEWCGGQPAAQR
ncbi:unnamed protein product, partial [Prorocentrum cordatum]